jgi:tetratricopeptide (TPR) repeat protein
MADDALRWRDAFLEEAEAFIAACDDETALTLAEARLLRMPGDLDARSVICRIRIRQGRMDEAGGMLREMEASLAGLSRVYASLGDAYLKQGLRESAQTAYRKCMGLNPDAPLSKEIAGRLDGIAQEPGTDPEGEPGDAAQQVPADFQTVTLAELYIRQGHLRPAAEVLETIIRKEPENEKAAALLREVGEMTLREESRQRYPSVITELSRWLDNIGRIGGHAA